MEATLRELLDLVVRWIHLIAGIMWIGNSMLWNWLDRNLEKHPEKGPLHQGTIWLVHSGSFYEMEKKQLEPSQMPKVLHWFKWQSYTTWMTGFALLFIVYYAGGGAYLVDPAVSKLTPEEGMGVGLGALIGGFAIYDLIWRSPLQKKEPVAVALCFALLAGAIYGLTHLLSGRAAYIHVGAMLGTCMSGNVFFHIIPSQRELVKATQEGKTQDLKLGQHAKQRSIHNNYMTFPVLFIMLSNHFPSTYGSTLNWAILGVLMVGGATARHFLNIRFTFTKWMPALGTAIGVTLVAAFFLMSKKEDTGALAMPANVGEKVSFTSVQIVLGQRCQPCHTAHPDQPDIKTPPNNIMFDTPEQIRMYRERIKARAVISKTMPLANRTGMTQDERDLLARWFLQGASVN